MKVLAYVNLPFDIDLKKEKAYIVLKDGYYIQKVKLMPIPQKKEIKKHRTGGYIDNEDELAEARGWNACLKEIVGDINDGLQRCMGETE